MSGDKINDQELTLAEPDPKLTGGNQSKSNAISNDNALVVQYQNKQAWVLAMARRLAVELKRVDSTGMLIAGFSSDFSQAELSDNKDAGVFGLPCYSHRLAVATSYLGGAIDTEHRAMVSGTLANRQPVQSPTISSLMTRVMGLSR